MLQFIYIKNLKAQFSREGLISNLSKIRLTSRSKTTVVHDRRTRAVSSFQPHLNCRLQLLSIRISQNIVVS